MTAASGMAYGSVRLPALTHHQVRINRLLYPLDRRRWAGLQLKVVRYQRCNRTGDDNCAWWCETRDPGRHVSGLPGEVAMGGVQIDQTTMHPDPDINAEAESSLRLITEPGYLPRDL